MRDIFTLESLTDSNAEHVVPVLLGGKFASRELIQRSTNQLLGSTIEPALFDAVLFFLNALGMTSRRGKAAGYNLEPGDDGGYRLASGLRPELRRPEISQATEDGRTVLSIVARDAYEARKLLEAMARKHGSLDLGQATAVARQQFVDRPFQHSLKIGPLELRAIAKMAYEGCAIAVGNDAICSEMFSGVRGWIMSGVQDAKAFGTGGRVDKYSYCHHDYRDSIWANLPSLREAPFQHRVFALSGPERVGAWAAVELFGTMRFSIYLSGDVEAPLGTYGYLVDPVSGVEDRNPVFGATLTAEDCRVVQFDDDRFRSGLSGLLESLRDMQEQSLVADIISTACKDILPSAGVVEESHMLELLGRITAELERHGCRRGREESIDVRALLDQPPRGEAGDPLSRPRVTPDPPCG